MPANNYYRSLMKSILLIVVVVPFMPMILVSGILLYQFHVSYKEKVHAHLGEVVQKGKQSIDIFLREKLGDIRFLAEVFSFEELREESFLQDILKTLQLQHGPVFVDLEWAMRKASKSLMPDQSSWETPDIQTPTGIKKP